MCSIDGDRFEFPCLRRYQPQSSYLNHYSRSDSLEFICNIPFRGDLCIDTPPTVSENTTLGHPNPCFRSGSVGPAACHSPSGPATVSRSTALRLSNPLLDQRQSSLIVAWRWPLWVMKEAQRSAMVDYFSHSQWSPFPAPWIVQRRVATLNPGMGCAKPATLRKLRYLNYPGLLSHHGTRTRLSVWQIRPVQRDKGRAHFYQRWRCLIHLVCGVESTWSAWAKHVQKKTNSQTPWLT